MDSESNVDKIKRILKRFDSQNPVVSEEDDGNPLLDLKLLIVESSGTELASLLRELDIRPFFRVFGANFLKTCDDKTAIEVIEVFRSLLDSLSPDFIAMKYHNEILSGLQSGSEGINALWLKALHRIIVDPGALMNLKTTNVVNPILSHVIPLLYTEYEGIAKYSGEIIMRAAEDENLKDHLFSEQCINQLKAVKGRDSVFNLRILSLMTDIAIKSRDLMTTVSEAGFFADLCDFHYEQDLLGTTNQLRMMAIIAGTEFGIEYLHLSGCLRAVANELLTEDLLRAETMMTHYMEVFCAVGKTAPSLIKSMYSSVMEKILDAESLEGSSHGTSIDVVGIISRTGYGKLMLSSFDQMKTFLRKFGSILSCDTRGLKLRCLVSLSSILDTSECFEVNGEMEKLAAVTEAWYSEIDGNSSETTKKLLGICRLPFPELRLAALDVIRVLCSHLWGQRELNAVTGFLDYILDRKTETELSGKHAKFVVVKELTGSPFTASVFNTQTRLRLRQFIKEGLLHVDGEPAVAVEGQ
ncbi:26S proteasome non-ATPase regulatory subunit 5 [Halotydeus destructor]|nr:26S proteasome non-ATPase regulatory subunit 5 [Halotydeus destructor]